MGLLSESTVAIMQAKERAEVEAMTRQQSEAEAKRRESADHTSLADLHAFDLGLDIDVSGVWQVTWESAWPIAACMGCGAGACSLSGSAAPILCGDDRI